MLAELILAATSAGILVYALVAVFALRDARKEIDRLRADRERQRDTTLNVIDTLWERATTEREAGHERWAETLVRLTQEHRGSVEELGRQTHTAMAEVAESFARGIEELRPQAGAPVVIPLNQPESRVAKVEYEVRVSQMAETILQSSKDAGTELSPAQAEEEARRLYPQMAGAWPAAPS